MNALKAAIVIQDGVWRPSHFLKLLPETSTGNRSCKSVQEGRTSEGKQSLYVADHFTKRVGGTQKAKCDTEHL